MVSRVNSPSLSRNGTGVMSITEHDVYTHSTSNANEVDASTKEKVEGGGNDESNLFESDLFAALDGEQLERLIKDPGDHILAPVPSIRASKRDSSSKKKARKKKTTDATKIFSSDAANNYYNAMRRSGSGIGSDVTKSDIKIECKAASKETDKTSNTTSSYTVGNTVSKKVNIEAKNSKEEQKKTLEELVSEACDVSIMSETSELQGVECLLGKHGEESSDGDKEKEELCPVTLTKQKEQQQEQQIKQQSFGFDDNNSQKGGEESKVSSTLAVPYASSFASTLSTDSSLTLNAEYKETIGSSRFVEEMSVKSEATGGSIPSNISDDCDVPIAKSPSIAKDCSKMSNAFDDSAKADDSDETAQVSSGESTEHDLKSVASTLYSSHAGSNESGIYHAIKVNDVLSRTGSFAFSSSAKNKNATSSQSIRSVRSMDPGRLMSSSNSEKKQAVTPQPKLQGACKHDDDRSDKSGISHAIKVNDVLSWTGSFNLSIDAAGSPERSGVCRARSASPGLSLSSKDGEKKENEALFSKNSKKKENEVPQPQKELSAVIIIDDDGSDKSGILHAIRTNDALSRTGSFAMESKTKKYGSSSLKKNIFSRVRSLESGLLLSSKTSEKKGNGARQPEQQIDGNNDDEGSDELKMLDATKADDALNLAGSSTILTSSKKNPSKKGVGRVRSTGSFFKKKKGFESPALNSTTVADDDGQELESMPGNTDIAPTTSAHDGTKLRLVRSMSSSLGSTLSLMKEKMISEEDTVESSKICQAKSDDGSDVSTAASSCSSASTMSITNLPPTAAVAGGANSAGNNEPKDTTANTDIENIESTEKASHDFPIENSESQESTCRMSLLSAKKRSSKSSKLVKKKKSELPPLVPSRNDSPTGCSKAAAAAVTGPQQQQPQQKQQLKIVAISEYDGSVECSF